MCQLRESLITTAEFAQELWVRLLSCRSLYERTSLNTLFVKGFTDPIREALHYWWAELRYSSVENLAQKAESLLDLQGVPQKNVNINTKQRQHRSAPRNIKRRKIQVVNIEKGSQLPCIRRMSSSSTEGHSLSRAGMLTNDFITTFESKNFDLDDMTLIESDLLCQVIMDEWHKTSKCRQIRGLVNF